MLDTIHRTLGADALEKLQLILSRIYLQDTRETCPFRADSQAELMEQITSFEPRPPRQLDDAVPMELERICLKSLSKRASERYTTAKDMSDDLGHFLGQAAVNQAHVSLDTTLAANDEVAFFPPVTGG